MFKATAKKIITRTIFFTAYTATQGSDTQLSKTLNPVLDKCPWTEYLYTLESDPNTSLSSSGIIELTFAFWHLSPLIIAPSCTRLKLCGKRQKDGHIHQENSNVECFLLANDAVLRIQ